MPCGSAKSFKPPSGRRPGSVLRLTCCGSGQGVPMSRFPLISIAEAQDIVLGLTDSLGHEEVAIEDAVGRILAADI
eukprot:6730193-Ditylum_brightwellii.AAC.1